MTNLVEYMSLFFNIVNNLILVLSGVMLYYWLKPFVKRKGFLASAAVLYTVSTYLLIYIPYDLTQSPIKLLPVGLTLLFLCLFDRRNYRQKVFLVTVFLVLRWFSIGLFAEFTSFEQTFMYADGLYSDDILIISIEFIVWELIWSSGIVASMYYTLKLLRRVYRFKEEEMSWQELIMLMTPMVALYLVKPMSAEYQLLWNQGIANGSITKNKPGSIYLVLFYLFAYAGSVFLVYFYQQIKNRQEEATQRELLEQQLEENRKSMEKIQGLYHEMRALRHDMGNHVAVLEHAIAAGELEQAAGYMDTLKERLNDTRPSFPTGHPIMDIVLSEFGILCREQGVAFCSRFFFPENTRIDVFDVSVVVSNGLKNALEAQKELPNPRIEIASHIKGGVYLISVRNTVREQMRLEDGELPATTKTEKGHGYGLKNIKGIAMKYDGDMNIRQIEENKEQMFLLDVMLRI